MVEQTAALLLWFARSALMRLAAAALVGRGADMATAQLRRDDGALVLVAGIGFETPFLEHFAVVEGDGTACAMASAGRGAIEVTDVAVDQIYDEPARRVMLAAGSRACISVPVLGIDGVVVGVISAHYRRQGQHDVDCVSRVATDALLARSHAPSLRIPERTEGAEQPGAPPAALVRLDDSHSRRQRAALERAVARHEQSAVFHETLATLAERHGQSDLATTARHRADENANAASLDRDRLHAFWPVVEPTGRLAPSGESAAPRQ